MNSWFNELNVSVIEFLKLLLSQKNKEQFKTALFKLYAADRAAFFLALDEKYRQTVLQFLQPDEFAEIFQVLDLEDRKLVVTGLDNNYVSDMVKSMPSHAAAAFLKSIPERKAASILQHIELKARSGIELCMKYPEHTAGSIMNTTFRLVRSTDTVEEVLNHLRLSKEEKCHYFVYVADQNQHLIGAVSMHHLLQAPTDSTIGLLMSTKFISIDDEAEHTTVVEMIKKYNLQALPVTDKNGVMIGIITVNEAFNLFEERIALRIQQLVTFQNGLNKKDRLQLLGKEAFVGLLAGIVCGLAASFLAKELLGFSFISGFFVGNWAGSH